jgi:uncharacterized protein GlcG (DUF336 family)
MKNRRLMILTVALTIVLFGVSLSASPVFARDNCRALGLGGKAALQGALTAALKSVAPGGNGGLGNHMWGTIVDQDGVVCAVTFTGDDRNSQWPGSRVISAQKANTAASFNLPAGLGGTVDALSTANLWTQAQPGGSLFGLQFSNPVDTKTAYKGEPKNYGTSKDPMVGKRIGGVNVFGGGLGLYDTDGNKVGAIGVSGDTSCADHNIAWRTRNALGLDNLVTGGVSGLSAAPLQDNIIFDLDEGTPDHHHAADNSTSGFGHPKCGFGEDLVVLPATQ